MAEHFDVIQEMIVVAGRLKKAPKTIFKNAREYAEAEKVYRMELGKEITKLKAEGLQASLIPDVARSNVAELKYKRDLCEGLAKSSIESKRALESQLSALQSILKVTNDV